jgi:hypothetical protein
MLSIGIVVVIVLYVGGIVWVLRRNWHVYATLGSPGTILRKTSTLRAFAHGNSCLAEGRFPEAIVAFQQARDLTPKHPHIAGRLAEVARQQQAASAAPSVKPTV